MKYLNLDGLARFKSKLIELIPTKTSQLTNNSNFVSDSSYNHTDNNFTTTLKTKLDGIANGATANTGTITGITMNGSSKGTSGVVDLGTVLTSHQDISDKNAGSATKLQTSRTIGLNTGATGTATSFNGTSNITIPVTEVKEAYVTWGGKAITANISPNDMGCIDEFGHNKLAFLPAGCIKVEYTTNGGTTWSDYGLTDEQKVVLVTTSGPSLSIGKGTVSALNGTLTNANCSNYKVRVTISTRNGSGQSSGALYTQARKWLINVSTNGASGVKVLIEDRTIEKYNNNLDSWSTVGTYDVNGWSGWNSIPYLKTFGGGQSQTSQIADIRFTMSISSVNTSYSSQACFIDFRLIGATNWSMPSELARAGHLYKTDVNKRAIFPSDVIPESNNTKYLGSSTNKWNNVYATTFTGNLTGTASKATGDKNGNDITTTYYKASNPNGYTSNTGTITGITMNGSSKGTSGVVDLGTVLTSHQDISGKQNTLIAGTNISIAADGKTISATDTTYSDATTTTHGLMSVSDKIKLNGLGDIVYLIDTGSDISTFTNSGTYLIDATLNMSYTYMFGPPGSQIRATSLIPLYKGDILFCSMDSTYIYWTIYAYSDNKKWIVKCTKSTGYSTGNYSTLLDTIGGDNLPVGTEVDYYGNVSDIPEGWQVTSESGEFLLYSGDSNGTITLSDNASNYEYIEIFFRTNDNVYDSTKVYQPNNKLVSLAAWWANANVPRFYTKVKIVTINGTSIQAVSSNQYGEVSYDTSSDPVYISNSNYIYITRVIGYRNRV